MEHLLQSEASAETCRDDWFREQSLVALRENLALVTYPGYPELHDRLLGEGVRHWALPLGVWETSEGATPNVSEQVDLISKDVRMDIYGRPLHPWVKDMLGDPKIGVVTGKGKYYHWGPNYTADSIILRHDQAEPQVLLIQRKDTKQWALPGGFIDGDEAALTAALRESLEETGIDLAAYNPEAREVYCGPLADIRVTAHAWPETTAFRFDLSDEAAAAIGDKIQGSDDAQAAAWVNVNELAGQLFGSHKLLIQLALEG